MIFIFSAESALGGRENEEGRQLAKDEDTEGV